MAAVGLLCRRPIIQGLLTKLRFGRRWPAAAFRVADTIERVLGICGPRGFQNSFWRIYCMRNRQLGRVYVTNITQNTLAEPVRSYSLVGRRPASVWLAGTIHRASWRSWCAHGCPLGCSLLSCDRYNTQNFLEDLLPFSSYIPSFIHYFQRHFSRTIFHTKFSHIQSFTKPIFVTHFFSQHFSHTQPCQTPIFSHNFHGFF